MGQRHNERETEWGIKSEKQNGMEGKKKSHKHRLR